jgi:hypothetical protein
VTKRRAYGDGGLYWNERRQRWIATVTVGYDGRGKRMVKTGSGRTKTEAKQKLREQLRDHEDGLALGRDDYTVGHAVEDWLAYGLGRQGPATITKYRIFCGKHIIPLLGARKLRDLTAREVDAWLLRDLLQRQLRVGLSGLEPLTSALSGRFRTPEDAKRRQRVAVNSRPD